MKRVGQVLLVAVLLTAGCGQDIRRMDERDRSEPLMQRARAASATGDVEGAAAFYREALDDNPRAARGHLDLALLLHDSVKDYVGAIHHYREYLRLRTDTQKSDMIENRIRLAEQALAARVLPEDREAGRTIRRLEREISALHQRVGELQTEKQALSDELSALRAARAAATAARGSVAAAAGEGGGTAGRQPDGDVTEYVVQPGDTLSSIALRLLGDAGKWHAIVDANKSILGNSDRVRVGQRLRIVKED